MILGSPVGHPIGSPTSLYIGVTWLWAPCGERRCLNHLYGSTHRRCELKEAASALCNALPHHTGDRGSRHSWGTGSATGRTQQVDVGYKTTCSIFLWWKSLCTCYLVHKSRPSRFQKPEVELFHWEWNSSMEVRGSSTAVQTKTWILVSHPLLTRHSYFPISTSHLLVCANSHGFPESYCSQVYCSW